jgi:penicillin amidase
VAAATSAGAGGPSPARGQSGGNVTIYWDGFGVPHVESATVEGVAYGTGYAQAKQRLFLTHGIRLTAQGRTAELLGRDSLEADVVQRRDFYDAADVQRQYDLLPDSAKRELQAFSDGFNQGMGEVMLDPQERPAAFDALGHYPEPWKPTDSVSVVALFTWVSFAGEGGGGQLRNAELLGNLQERFGNRRGLGIWNDLTFKNDPKAPFVASPGEGRKPPAYIRSERLPSAAQQRLARSYAGTLGRTSRRMQAQALRLAEIFKRVPLPRIGSYAAAIAGKRTKSGGAIVVGSPQTGLNTPPIFWQLGQHAPGRDCTGFTVPGLGPWMGIGRCNDHAWSLVAGNMGEQVDHYVERVDPANPRRYRWRGGWRDMTVREETFTANKCVPPVCDEPTPASTETHAIESTVHGPVVARDEKAGIAITQRRAQRGQWARSIRSVIGWNTAQTLREFEDATDLATGSYNLLYGDAAGHALYRFTGFQPERAPGFDRRLPEPGGGSAEWRRMMPQRTMPRVLDPKSGVVAANQGVESKPAYWWPNASGILVGQANRIGGNRRLIMRAGRLDVPALERLNPRLLERTDSITPVFAGHLRRALAKSNDPRIRRAWALWREWAKAGFPRVDSDGDGYYDHPAVVIFGGDHFDLRGEDYPRAFWDLLDNAVFADELGARTRLEERGPFSAPGGGYSTLSRLKLALDGPGRASVPLSRDYVDDMRTRKLETPETLIRISLLKSLRVLEKKFGTQDMRRWLGRVPTQRFGALGLVEAPPIRGFDHGTYSQIVDPKAGAGRYILPPGNDSADGAPEVAAAMGPGEYPEHVVDQRLLYEAYDFLDMPFAKAQYSAAPEKVQELTYSP